MANDPFLENQIPHGRDDDAAQQTIHAQLPCLFALPRACIDAGHEEDDVQGRKRVEDLARVSRVKAGLGRLLAPTLSEKFHVCQMSLVAEEVNMSR